jgi:hypothetical protein
MTRHLVFAITILVTGVLLNSPPGIANQLQCEDRGANCLGKCADPTGGAGDLGGHQNKCLLYCSRQLASCMVRNATIQRYYAQPEHFGRFFE